MNVFEATRRATWLGFAAAIVAFRIRPAATRRVLWVVTSTLGLAHGAADDGLLAERGTFAASRRWIALGYGASAFATYAAARVAPRTAGRALLALTWFHFGSGDRAFARACEGRRDRRWEWLVAGAVPICGSLPALRPAALIGVSALALDALARRRIANAVDLALPAVAFALAPTRDTFLAYFALWHTPRHLAMILGRYLRDGRLVARVRRFARYAGPNTLAAFAVALPLVRGTQPRAASTTERTDDGATAFIIAITVPHLAAVALLEGSADDDRA